MVRAFKTWLEQQGLRAAPTRLTRYVKTLDRLAERGGPEHGDYDEYIFTLREADEMIWVHHGLLKAIPPGALALLEKSIGGEAFAREDKRSAARNALFELRIASYFLQAGFSIDLSGPADIAIELPSARVYVECKRIESRKKVPARANEAFKQLRRHLSGMKRWSSYGLAVLDVGQIIHPGQGMSMGVTRGHLRDGLRQELLGFANEFSISEFFMKERRILSVWLQAMVPSIHLTEHEVATRFSSIHLPLVGERGPRAKVFRELRRAFELGG